MREVIVSMVNSEEGMSAVLVVVLADMFLFDFPLKANSWFALSNTALKKTI